jgi:hypothetical protein
MDEMAGSPAANHKRARLVGRDQATAKRPGKKVVAIAGELADKKLLGQC